MKVKETIINILKGAGIGIACVVPGVSGGTIAVLLGVYDKILYAVSNIRKEFKNSLKFLWPIVLGIVIGLVAMVYPLLLAIKYFPLPTVLLFVGLIIGGLPGLTPKIKRKPSVSGSVAMLLAICVAVGICFISNGKDVDLSSSMPVWMYFILILVGILGSCALTIPGISGSMLLLIIGFWTPILNAAKSILSFTNIWQPLLVLAMFGIGVIIGFFLISKLMTYLLKVVPYQTYMAIIGFILGSIFSIFYAIHTDFIPYGPTWAIILVGCVLFIIGLAGSFSLVYFSSKNKKIDEKQKVIEEEEKTIEGNDDTSR